VGAYVLGAHPGQYVYLALFDESNFVYIMLTFISFSGKAAINTFNLIYFFDLLSSDLFKREPLAHALWISPALLLIGLPIYFGLVSMKYHSKYFSTTAQQIAEQEFKKVTCRQVRENDGKELAYLVDEHKVHVSFKYDYTG